MTIRNILLAEDNAEEAFLLQRVFRNLNSATRLLRVSNGEEAVEYLCGSGEFAERERYPLPSLLLLDVKMPGRSGFEVLSWVRTQEDRAIQNLPAVMFTNSREEKDVLRAYSLGASSYLVKPSTLDELRSMMREFDHYWMDLNQPPPPLA